MFIDEEKKMFFFNNKKKIHISFELRKAFENLSVNETVGLLNNTLSNIFRNYIPNKICDCSYRDPPWITKQIKSRQKNRSKINY